MRLEWDLAGLPAYSQLPGSHLAADWLSVVAEQQQELMAYLVFSISIGFGAVGST